MRITAIIEREGTGYVALCPELDIASQGEDIPAARNNLQEAVELFLECASPQRSTATAFRGNLHHSDREASP